MKNPAGFQHKALMVYTRNAVTAANQYCITVEKFRPVLQCYLYHIHEHD